MDMTNVNVWIEEDVKKEAEEILAQLGISSEQAITLFYQKIIEVNGLPFTMPTLEDLSDEEFKRMIMNGYKQALEGKVYDADEVFAELEERLSR